MQLLHLSFKMNMPQLRFGSRCPLPSTTPTTQGVRLLAAVETTQAVLTGHTRIDPEQATICHMMTNRANQTSNHAAIDQTSIRDTQATTHDDRLHALLPLLVWRCIHLVGMTPGVWTSLSSTHNIECRPYCKFSILWTIKKVSLYVDSISLNVRNLL